MPDLPIHIWEITVQVDNGDWYWKRTDPVPFHFAVHDALRFEKTLEDQGGRLVSIANVDHKSEPHTIPPAGTPHDNPRFPGSLQELNARYCANPFHPESPEGRAWENGDRSSIS